MHTFLSRAVAAATFLLACVSFASAQCIEFGLDIANGGTYFINLASSAPFSFKTGYSGCITESVSPILTLPGGNQVTCTSISTNSADAESVCPVTHSQMAAGSYLLDFSLPANGFLAARGFTVVNTQFTSILTTTETVTGTVTPISTVTSLTTSQVTDTSTLPPVIVTSPAATLGTLTIHPTITISTTKTIIHRTISATTISTTSTKTVTKAARCTSTPVKMDSVARASGVAAGTLARRYPPTVRRSPAIAEKRALRKRDGPDGPLTTTITTSASPVVILQTANPSTVTATSLTVITSTSTVTPPPQTVLAGTVPFTVTAPTKTKTSTLRLQLTETTITTRTRNFGVAVTVMPSC